MVSAALDGKWNEWPSPVNEISIKMNSHISFYIGIEMSGHLLLIR